MSKLEIRRGASDSSSPLMMEVPLTLTAFSAATGETVRELRAATLRRAAASALRIASRIGHDRSAAPFSHFRVKLLSAVRSA